MIILLLFTLGIFFMMVHPTFAPQKTIHPVQEMPLRYGAAPPQEGMIDQIVPR